MILHESVNGSWEPKLLHKKRLDSKHCSCGAKYGTEIVCSVYMILPRSVNKEVKTTLRADFTRIILRFNVFKTNLFLLSFTNCDGSDQLHGRGMICLTRKLIHYIIKLTFKLSQPSNSDLGTVADHPLLYDASDLMNCNNIYIVM